MSTSRLLTALAFGSLTLALIGCQANRSAGPCVVSAASTEQENATLGKLKSLKGNWVVTKMNGQEVPFAQQGSVSFTPSSKGSVVREVMFAGAEHEMTNMYHMDGSDVLVTHYCAMGNQPRMRCTGANGNDLEFKFDSATNVRSADEECMGELTVRFINDRTIEQIWTSSKGGKKEPHMVFTLERKSW